jgi:hypothetical protein
MSLIRAKNGQLRIESSNGSGIGLESAARECDSVAAATGHACAVALQRGLSILGVSPCAMHLSQCFHVLTSTGGGRMESS